MFSVLAVALIFACTATISDAFVIPGRLERPTRRFDPDQLMFELGRMRGFEAVKPLSLTENQLYDDLLSDFSENFKPSKQAAEDSVKSSHSNTHKQQPPSLDDFHF